MIDIREVWPGEAREFTPWLADNLDVLATHLEIGELELDSTEVEVPGGRRLDILAKDLDGANWAIENQYGEADHDHLTRALAYAVGLECRAVIVVAESHRDEFVAVADEWNRYSEAYGADGVRLFLAVVEVGRIGDSDPGFRFRRVAGPNEWKSETATGQRPLSDADRIRYRERNEFWAGLEKVMREKGSLSWSTSRRSVHSHMPVVTWGPFNFQFVVRMQSCGVALWIDSSDKEKNDDLFNALAAEREAVHQALGADLEWENKPKVRSSGIYRVPEGACGYRSSPQERHVDYESWRTRCTGSSPDAR